MHKHHQAYEHHARQKMLTGNSQQESGPDNKLIQY